MYWGCMKAMQWKLPFYVAALLYTVLYVGYNWALGSAYSGAVANIELGQLAIRLLVAIGIYYLLDYFDDSEQVFLPPIILVAGFIVLEFVI